MSSASHQNQMEVIRQWGAIFNENKQNKSKPCQPRVLYPVKTYFKNESKIIFITEFVTSRPVPQGK